MIKMNYKTFVRHVALARADGASEEALVPHVYQTMFSEGFYGGSHKELNRWLDHLNMVNMRNKQNEQN